MGRKPVSASSATCAQNAKQRKTQAFPKFSSGPDSLPEFTHWIVPQTFLDEHFSLISLSLGLCGGICGRSFARSLGLGDGRERFHVEFPVVPIACHDAGLDS